MLNLELTVAKSPVSNLDYRRDTSILNSDTKEVFIFCCSTDILMNPRTEFMIPVVTNVIHDNITLKVQ